MEDTYKNIIVRIRETKPELEQPELLTERIMNEINKKVPLKKSDFNLLYKVIQPILSAAAIFLTGLFIIQYNEPVQVKYSNFKQNNTFPEIQESLTVKKSGSPDNKTWVREYQECISAENSLNTINRTCLFTALLSYFEKKQDKSKTFNNQLNLYQSFNKK